MKSRRSLIAYVATLFTLGAALASAQQSQPSATAANNPSSGEVIGSWAYSFQTFNAWRGKLYVVTVDRPTQRYSCNVQSATAAGITCAASGLRSARTFAADKIAAVLSPRHHSHSVLFWFLGCLAVGAGLLAAAYIAPISLAFTVPFGILGGFVLLVSPLTAMMADEEEDIPEGVLYSRPTPASAHN